MALTETQVKTFWEQGALFAEDVLTDDDLNPVINAMSVFIDQRARELKEQGKIAELYENEPFVRRYARLFAQSQEIGHGMDIYELCDPAVFDFLRNDHLMDAVECLIGPEITCSPIQHIRAKPPARLSDGSGYNLPWHQDSGVSWEESDQAPVVTCWIPLVDATVERGCMEVIPGVFRNGHLTHYSADGTTIRPELMPDTPPVAAEIRKGGVIFLSQFTPHRSTPNRTEWDVRWSMDLRYVPYGAPTGRPFFPDFCTRSRSNPERALTDHTTWRRQWEQALEEQRRNPQKAHRV